jgi:hypothetical protein
VYIDFSTIFSETFFIPRRTERDVIKNVQWCSYSVYVILVIFNDNLIVSTNFRESTQISTFMKIRPVGAELFHADGQMDRKNLTFAFRNFANAPKKGSM